MNFILATVPIRSQPDHYPPVGSTALLDTLIKAGYDPKFYDINVARPSFQEVLDYFRREEPDIFGISAVVSTAYRYAKELAHGVKRVSPKTKVILGGCLAASAEILLRKCPIDICVIGEGERILMNLVRHWEKFHDFDPSQEELQKIKGIAFINPKNDFIFTGYETQLPPEELPQPNYGLLERFSDIDHYMPEGIEVPVFSQDKRSHQPHRKGQKYCQVMTGKGCVSRCTFCHRWVKGYRRHPIDDIVGRIKYLKERYNAGYFVMGDESFGADPRMLDEFVEAVGPLDILFSIGAIRIATVYRRPEIVRRLKEAGCVRMIFGMESGSDKILTVMEKTVTAEQNLEVARLLAREGMNTCHQLVIGMPGENEGTIRETIDCVKSATEDMEIPPDAGVLSINYFQALPGTPAYEFMRLRGLFGKTLDDEERYLLKVSDTDAASREHYLNISEEALSRVFLWPHKIITDVTVHWYRRRGWRRLDIPKASLPHKDEGLIRFWYLFRTTMLYYQIASLSGRSFWFVMLFLMRVRLYGFVKALLFTTGIRKEEDRHSFIIMEPRSLRRVVTYPERNKMSISEANMLPLRLGR